VEKKSSRRARLGLDSVLGGGNCILRNEHAFLLSQERTDSDQAVRRDEDRLSAKKRTLVV